MTLAALSVMVASTVHGQDNAGTASTVSLKGYDVVAYFTEGRAAKGSPEFRQDWDNVGYYFSNRQHKAAFAAEPDRYVPQFSGLCAMGVGMGKKVEADPTLWKIVDGKLYVFSSAKALDLVEKDPGVLTRSHQNWPGLR